MKDIITSFLETSVTTFALRGPVIQVGGGHSYCVKRLLPTDEYLLCRLETEARRVRLPIPDGSARLALLIDPDGRRTSSDSSSDTPGHLSSRKQGCMRQLLAELIRTTTPGGAILIALRTIPSTACLRWRADRATDFPGWVPTPNLLQNWFSEMAVSLVGWQGDALRPRRLFGVGMKRPAGPAITRSVGLFLDRIGHRADESVGWIDRWLKIFRQIRAKIHGDQPCDPNQFSWLAHFAQTAGTTTAVPHIGLKKGNHRMQDMV